LIDKGSKKNVYHKNTAARKKAKLAALLKMV
jgi:ribosomal protein S20